MKDFEAFTADDPDEKSTRVLVDSIEIVEAGALVLIRVQGSHFLWKMVRRMVGVLAAVGRGELQPPRRSAAPASDSGRDSSRSRGAAGAGGGTVPRSGALQGRRRRQDRQGRCAIRARCASSTASRTATASLPHDPQVRRRQRRDTVPLPPELHDLEVVGGQRANAGFSTPLFQRASIVPLMYMSEPLSATIRP